MAVIPLIRQGVLGVTTIFSLIELAIAAHLISQTQQYLGFTATFSALAIAVAVISLLTLPVMFVVDHLRHGAFTSMILVEVVWLSTLCILWVATAGEATSEYNGFFPLGCGFTDSISNGLCREAQAIQAFSFLNFIIILLYVIGLTILALIAANRGEGVWLSSVKESFSSFGSVQYPMSQREPPAPSHEQVVSQNTTGVTQDMSGPGHAV